MHQKSFIETQFPVSMLSKESYKERKANYSQTLTGLGKWWGRKPLILVRATILGLLMPASNNPKKDREIFLKILTMDNEGLLRRKNKCISVSALYEALPENDRVRYFELNGRGGVKFKRGVSFEEKEGLHKNVFKTYTYDEKLELCCRPEHLQGPSEEVWPEINAHLGTSATSLSELIQQMGELRLGHTPRVGDSFTGGGSIPFEAARIGCDAFGSDLNPVAAMLTWASLNIIGGGEEVAEQVFQTQQTVYEAVDQQITEWGIEHNTDGWRADAFLYCTETRCPECGWMVPMAPSWVIGEKTRTVAQLVPDDANRQFRIDILSGATDAQMKEAKKGTTGNSQLSCPNPGCGVKTPVATIRVARRNETGTITNIRMWENCDIVPRIDDIFQERLYCIRWVEQYSVVNIEESKSRRYYRSVSKEDMHREEKVRQLLRERFDEWQKKGYIPNKAIEPGKKTDEPIRTRGWTHWHQLFNPRQLLVLGSFMEKIFSLTSKNMTIACLLALNKCLDRNSKLCLWDSSAANEKVANTFLNQALNTTYNYGLRTSISLKSSWFYDLTFETISSKSSVKVNDARTIKVVRDYWITDPPYADAVNYHELSEFFLVWQEKHLPKLFPGWYGDSKRALAVKGNDEGFRRSMVDCYRNLTQNMPDNGMQVVMFTHQDAGVWADLAIILWAAGLQVTAAWTIATETDAAGYKKGNYVQGTVLLVLRKRTSGEIAFLDDITHDIKPEVERQLQSMLEIEDKDDPNFTDSDYQLAAYAAALRVLTSYKQIEDFDAEREISRPRKKGDKSPIEAIIENGVKIASNFLIPKSLHEDEITRRELWRNLSADERFYIKGLEIESHGDYRQGVYQEFAKGFGLREYTNMLESSKANETRLKTASEFKRRELGTPGFGSTLTRHVLFAISQVVAAEDVSLGLRWLKEEIPGDYWQQKQSILALLRYIAKLAIEHWQEDSNWAQLLAGTVENDTV